MWQLRLSSSTVSTSLSDQMTLYIMLRSAESRRSCVRIWRPSCEEAPSQGHRSFCAQLLLNESRKTGRPFNELLQYYAIERFLYRLSKSAFAGKFILKGALMLMVWKAPLSRPTRDMDFLGKIDNDIDAIARVVRDVCSTEVEPNGLRFGSDTIEAEWISEDADYEGVRVSFQGNIGNARISMQLDVGFGDLVVPGTKTIEYPMNTQQSSKCPRLFLAATAWRAQSLRSLRQWLSWALSTAE
jgi:hypothetical protein